MALALPLSAAATYSLLAAARSFLTPWPFSSMLAYRYCAGPRPLLAARSYQRAASSRLAGTPRPSTKRMATSYAAAASPACAALRSRWLPMAAGNPSAVVGCAAGCVGRASAGARAIEPVTSLFCPGAPPRSGGFKIGEIKRGDEACAVGLGFKGVWIGAAAAAGGVAGVKPGSVDGASSDAVTLVSAAGAVAAFG